MLVRNCMSRELITVTPDDTLATALVLTRRHRVRHLPVVLLGGDLVGILSDRDIRLAMPSPLTTPDAERSDFLERTAIAGIMSRDVVTVGPDDTIEDAAKLLYRHRIGALPVVDPQQQLRGILSETDILHAFVRILGVAEPSSRIEVELPDRPGELGKAMTMMSEATGVNVVSIILPSLGRDENKTAVLHLATIDPREAIQVLEQGGYTVGWPSLARKVPKLGELRVTG
ncbi:MAG: CBS domain-containing protein [Gemmatimonas sp.]|nr:CBS domain-containing protein [Gemmatimonas sp.]